LRDVNSDAEEDDFFDEESEKILNRMKVERLDEFNAKNSKVQQDKGRVGEYIDIKEDEFLSSVT